MRPVVSIVYHADRSDGLGGRRYLCVARHDKINCALRRDDLIQNLLTRFSNDWAQSMKHWAVVPSLKVLLDLAYHLVRTISVVEDCIAFGGINNGFDVVGALSSDCDDWLNVAVACKLDSVCTDRCICTKGVGLVAGFQEVGSWRLRNSATEAVKAASGIVAASTFTRSMQIIQ